MLNYSTLTIYVHPSDQGLGLHTYVCLAVINWLRDELLEQDGPDISGAFASIPFCSENGRSRSEHVMCVDDRVCSVVTRLNAVAYRSYLKQ